MKSEEKLLTIRDAAAMLAISTSTLYGWVWQRRIPFVKVGRAVRFRLVDIEGFIAVNRFEVRTPPQVATRSR